MTPLTKSAAPFVEKSISRYARRRSSVDSSPIESKRFLIVPLLSSAARIPFPGATSARAVACNSAMLIASLPFNRAGRLRSDVVRHPVDARNLVDDARRDALEHLVRQPGPVGRHGVVGGDGPADDRVRVGTVVAHHADGAHR